MPKAGKRTTTDAMVEQAVKEREEKEHKIQVLKISYLIVAPSFLLFLCFCVFLNTHVKLYCSLWISMSIH